MKITFLHRPKPRQYSYKPVFYNPEEEERKERMAEPGSRDHLRQEIRQKWGQNRSRKKSSSLSLMLYILIILGMLYLIFIAW
mgnify:CR=1 FL=1